VYSVCSASGVTASFGEMLLLMAIHFHSNQLSAICELVCSTLGMKVSAERERERLSVRVCVCVWGGGGGECGGWGVVVVCVFFFFFFVLPGKNFPTPLKRKTSKKK